MILEPTTHARIESDAERGIASAMSFITYPTHAGHDPSSGIIVQHHGALTSPPSKLSHEASDTTCAWSLDPGGQS